MNLGDILFVPRVTKLLKKVEIGLRIGPAHKGFGIAEFNAHIAKNMAVLPH